MNLPTDIRTVIEKIVHRTNPVSIFLYGSRARDDYLADSDFEIGVLYRRERATNEIQLRLIVPLTKSIRIYPYILEDFITGDFDLPFETTTFLRLIKNSAITLWGDRVVENFHPPAVTIVSLLREVKFQLGRASDAIVCHRSDNQMLAAEMFYKSCLLGTRDLVILKCRLFPNTYPEIVKSASGLNLKDYSLLVNCALETRLNRSATPENLIRNIWYLNRLVERKIMNRYRKRGDEILLP